MQFAKYLPRSRWLLPPCGHLPSRNVLVISENIVFPDGMGPGALHMKRGKFKRAIRVRSDSPFAISQLAEQTTNLGGHVMDVGSSVVSPGVIDLSAQFNEPGNLWAEGLASGTAAAAAGGVTTVVDLPVQCSPAVTDAKTLRRKRGFVSVRSC